MVLRSWKSSLEFWYILLVYFIAILVYWYILLEYWNIGILVYFIYIKYKNILINTFTDSNFIEIYMFFLIKAII